MQTPLSDAHCLPREWGNGRLQAGCSAEHCAAAAAAGQLEARLLLVWHSSADEIHPRRTALDSSRQAGQTAIGRNGDDGGGGPRGAIDYAGQYYGAWAVAPQRCAAGTRALQGLWLRSLDSVDRVTISHPDRAGPGKPRVQTSAHGPRATTRASLSICSGFAPMKRTAEEKGMRQDMEIGGYDFRPHFIFTFCVLLPLCAYHCGAPSCLNRHHFCGH